MKKFTALLLTLILCFSLVACSSSNTKNDTPDATQGGQETEQVEDVVFTFPVGQIVGGIQSVEDEINKITEEKIKVRVKLNPITWADYNNQIGLMMTSDDPIDLITVINSGLSQMVAKNQLMAMDPYLDTYGAGAKEAVGDEFLKAATVDGSVYEVPTLNGKAAVVNIVIEKDLLEANDISTDNLKQAATFEEYCANLDELTKIFAQLKEAAPDKVCLVPSSVGDLIFTSVVPGMDNLGDGVGVLDKDGKTVINYSETEEYRTLLGYVHDWYEKGYILQDAATTTESPQTYLSSGRTTGYFIIGEEGQAEQITTATGVDVVSIKLVRPTITTSGINNFGFGISSTSKHPEATMKFMNEMYINEEIVNLLAWGIEGTHYEKQDDGTVDFPAGVDASNTTYGLNENWLFGNTFLSYIWGKGRDTTVNDRLLENNKTAEYSPVLGFAYDSTPIHTELTAVVNVSNEYGPGLNTGTLDPETDLQKYNDALKKAGMDNIIAEKQKQLDTWLEVNK